MTLLIKNVRIVGGEGEYSENVDVFVNGDKISAIGNFPTKSADKILDGQGAYLGPGFIDINTDSDHYLTLFDYPEQEDFLRQGVTTIIGGNCGSSLAPLIYGTLESVQKWGDISKVNVDWHTVEEFLAILDKKPLAVNFGTLAGHSTIRRAIVGEELRDLTKNELAVFGETLRKALKGGALGLSTGLSYVHGAKTPYSELKFLAGIVKEYGGVYSTHLPRSGHEISDSIDETIKLAEETGVKAEISHLMPVKGAESQYEAVYKKIDDLPEDINLNFDAYPSDVLVFPLYMFLPDWAKSGGWDVMYANLEDDWKRQRIQKDIPEIDPNDFVLAQAPGNEFLIGRSLKDLCVVYNIYNYREALIKLMLVTRLRGLAFYKAINYDLAKRAIISRRAFVSTNSASYPYSGKMLKTERAVSSFPKFLDVVIRSKAMSLEKAIEKITSEPAKKLGLEKRGVIKNGNFADLVVFSVDENALPLTRCVDIRSVVVSGEVVLEDGMFRKKLPGKTLKHKVE